MAKAKKYKFKERVEHRNKGGKKTVFEKNKEYPLSDTMLKDVKSLVTEVDSDAEEENESGAPISDLENKDQVNV